MFMGHYGPSFALRRSAARVSLGWLFVAAQLLDYVWAILVLLGVEQAQVVPWLSASRLDLYYMPYSHGLEGALAWSLLAGVVALWVVRGSEHERISAAMVVGLTVFSHWILDAIVHRPDLGLLGDARKIGLSVYDHPVATFLMEAALLVGGAVVYARETRLRGRGRDTRLVAFIVILVVVNLVATFGPPPPSVRVAALFNLTVYTLAALAAFVIDRGRVLVDAPADGLPTTPPR
jgi:hypothetical protein